MKRMYKGSLGLVIVYCPGLTSFSCEFAITLSINRQTHVAYITLIFHFCPIFLRSITEYFLSSSHSGDSGSIFYLVRVHAQDEVNGL